MENLEKKNKALRIIACSLAILLIMAGYFIATKKTNNNTVNTNTNTGSSFKLSKDQITKTLTEINPDFVVDKINFSSVAVIEGEIKNKKDQKNLKDVVIIDDKNGFYDKIGNIDELVKKAQEQKRKLEELKKWESLPVKDKFKKSKVSLSKVTKDDKILGSSDAELFIVEYSDLECPYCKRFNDGMKKIEDKYKDGKKVAVVFRSFPLSNKFASRDLHPTSDEESNALECVYKLNGSKKAFEFKDKVFETTKSDGHYDLKTLPDLASSIGVDKEKFTACYNKNEGLKNVERDFKSGEKAGVDGTPTVFIQDKEGKSLMVVSNPNEIEKVINEYFKK